MTRRCHQLALLAACCLLACLCIAQDDHSEYFGRYDPQHPVCRCCSGADCIQSDRGRYAFVTSVRTFDYLTGLRELHCSLQRTNAHIPLIVMGVEGDLDPERRQQVENITEYRIVEDIKQENSRNPRFGLNWVKLRAWEWTEFDVLIILDSDTIVLQDLSHLFSLPTDFAWASHQGHSGWNFNRGGFIFLRPCQAVFDSMLHLMRSDSSLQFVEGHAEQSFLSWFFRYTALDLPMKYNLNFKFLVDGLTPGGDEPAVLHFANKNAKPFAAQPGDEEWKYLCWQPLHYNAGQGLSNATNDVR